jgi:hypothetical protein
VGEGEETTMSVSGVGYGWARTPSAGQVRRSKREEGEAPRGPDGWVPPVSGREGGGVRLRG